MLQTSTPDLALVPLNEHFAAVLHDLVQENRAHLTAHGDYTEHVAASLETLQAELCQSAGENMRFGILLNQKLIGRMDLVPVDPPRFGVGYWLAQSATGRGYATAALKALLHFARADLQATDIFAGVTHGNQRSRALLERVGFLPVAEFEKYTRFHCALSAGP